MHEAIDQGETLIGESKEQEIQEKYPDIKTDDIETHFIGHLQTNKVNNVLNHVSYIHSVDRIKLAKALNKRDKKLGKKLNILIEVNTSYADSKYDDVSEDTIELIEK